MQDAATIIVDTIRSILERRSADPVVIHMDSELYDELELDSLEVAELSAVLEESLGTDPYSVGVVPHTVGEVVDFYKTS